MAQSTYIITYDVAEDGDYGEIIQRIKGYPAWAHIALSTWAVVTAKSAVQIRDNLKEVLPDGSRLFVLRSGGGAAWSNTFCKNSWLKKWL